MIAAAPPSIPAGVVAAAVSRSCFQRPGLLFLVASLRKCPITSSAIGSTEFALRTAFMPLFHTAVWNRGMNAVRNANSVEPIADEVMGHFLSDATKKSRPGRWKHLRDTAAATTPAGMLGGAAAIMNYDFTAQLPSVRVPTMALRGAQDPDGTEPAMRQLAQLVPGARYEEIPNANHFCNVDQPDAFNRIMMGWLDEQRKLT